MTLALSGRNVLVTGASSGIGKAIAAACVELGAQVACIARTKETLAATCAEIGAVPVVADITNEESVGEAVEAAASALGGINCLVNNAGAMLHSRITEGRSADWRVMLDSNIMSILLMSSAVTPHLRSAGFGDIVNVSSTSALRVSAPEYAVYCATKAAVNMLTIGLRLELAEHNIRVSNVMPGMVANTGFGPGIRDAALREQVMGMKDIKGIAASSVADAVCNMIGQPANVRMNDVVIVPAWQTT